MRFTSTYGDGLPESDSSNLAGRGLIRFMLGIFMVSNPWMMPGKHRKYEDSTTGLLCPCQPIECPADEKGSVPAQVCPKNEHNEPALRRFNNNGDVWDLGSVIHSV